MKCIELRYYEQKVGSATKPTDPVKSPQVGVMRSPYLDARELGSFSPTNYKGHHFSILALSEKRASLLSY